MPQPQPKQIAIPEELLSLRKTLDFAIGKYEDIISALAAKIKDLENAKEAKKVKK